jgi:large subunit ribosomal protein L30
MSHPQIEVTLVKSSIGINPQHKKVLQSMGLRKVGATKKYQNSPVIQGMIRKVNYLIRVQEA